MTGLRPGMKIEVTASNVPSVARVTALTGVDAALTALRDKLTGAAISLTQWQDVTRACVWREPDEYGDVWCDTHANYRERDKPDDSPCMSAPDRA
jgi:hypothetical protein